MDGAYRLDGSYGCYGKYRGDWLDRMVWPYGLYRVDRGDRPDGLHWIHWSYGYKLDRSHGTDGRDRDGCNRLHGADGH